MSKKTFHMYSDPSHGWLRVKRSDVEDLGILPKISHYSYQKGKYLYLEEDCDMPLFLNHVSKEEISIVEHISDSYSSIRYYDRVQGKYFQP